MEDKSLNLLSIGQASEYLGVSIDTLRRWEKKGKIISYRSPGGHRYFKKDELDGMFGKKYERSEETKPRKVYTTDKGSRDVIEADTKAAETIEIVENNDNDQKVVDAIISEVNEVDNEIEDFFSRQPKDISIPRLDPIRVVSQTVVSTNASMPLTSSFTPSVPTAPSAPPKLFTSFSQIPESREKSYKVKSPITPQFLLAVVAGIVFLIAVIFVVIFFASKPAIISPI